MPRPLAGREQYMSNRDEVAIVGYAGRLPGGRTSEAFWSLLRENRSSVTWITPDRFPTHAFYHPSPEQSGRSYTFAAGLIDDVWGFDASAFGMSPREAEQVDPQQRQLLEVMHDALGHAGIRPSSLAGTQTGVYVGASSVDYGARFVADPSAADVHMMTGNTLSVISNRLSYNLDLRGPSFTVDTACSSSLVALNLAAEAIRNGTIETAIVGGVNILLSPFSFVGFSRASMLSPTGRCRPFDAAADGYVRAEGAIVLILRSMAAARKGRNTIHAGIVGSGVGQDGRTTGLSLPSAESQRQLLEQVYGDFSVDPGDLVYLEAHGTGTKVGDPMEADALGKGLAQRRSQPLPIGSVKSNIGHLEPASGLAGVLKSLLTFKHGAVPATLHQQSLNPDIPFDELNLRVVDRNLRLEERRGPSLIGVNSFGFGGTNAHVILRGQHHVVSMVHVRSQETPPLLLSAHSPAALRSLASSYVSAWPADSRTTSDFFRAAAHLRDPLPHRLVALGKSAEEVRQQLRQFENGDDSPSLITGQALGVDLSVAFLFSGNGSQWVGMGRGTYRSNSRFRNALDEVDRHFAKRQGWSLPDMLFAEDLAIKIRIATYAQPLLLGLQVATVRVLEDAGVTPVATLGHSVGEIAAAWAAGMLSLEQAVDVVIARSRHQESARGSGGMAALMLSEREARRFLKSVNALGVDVAAINSWRSVTISGPGTQVDRVVAAATEQKISARKLDLDYPFHSALVDSVRAPLLRELDGLRSLPARRRFVSSVTGDFAGQTVLDANHWWRNVRDPVQFEAGFDRLVKEGVRVFVEVGPRPILASYVRDSLREAGARGAFVETLIETEDAEGASIEQAVSKVFLSGGRVDLTRFVGTEPAMTMPLPLYPWQHNHFEILPTAEASTTFVTPAHPLLGVRPRTDSTEWFSTIDPALFPWIADHKVGGIPVFPATAYVETMLAAGRQRYTEGPIELRDLDIVKPLAFDGNDSYETLVRFAPETAVVEFLSRLRGTPDWLLNARGILGRASVDSQEQLDVGDTVGNVVIPQARVYQISHELGFDYGPSFRRVQRAHFPDTKTGVATLNLIARLPLDNAVIDFTGLDAAFHTLFASEDAGVSDMALKRMLPIRFGRVRVFVPGAVAVRALARTVRRSATSMLVNIELIDETDTVVLSAQGVRLVDAPVASSIDVNAIAYRTVAWRLERPGEPSDLPSIRALEQISSDDATTMSEALLLLEAGCLRTIWKTFAKHGVSEGGVSDTSHLRSALLWHLEATGLVADRSGVRFVAESCELPELDSVVRSLLIRHPAMAGEAAMLSRLGEILGLLLAGDDNARAELTSTHWRQVGAVASQLVALRDAVMGSLILCLNACQRDQIIRLLIVGADQAIVVRELAARFPNLDVIVTDHDNDRLSQARAMLGDDVQRVRFTGWTELDGLLDGTVDAVCAIDALSEIAAFEEGMAKLQRLMRPYAVLVAGELAPSVFWDAVRGARSSWWARSVNTDYPIGALLTSREWADELEGVGFSAVTVDPVLGNERLGVIVSCRADRSRTIPMQSSEALSFALEGEAIAAAGELRTFLPATPGSNPTDIVWSIDCRTEEHGSPTKQASFLRQLLARFAERCRTLAPMPARLWMVLDFGDFETNELPLQRPLWCAITAAVRVARNEYPSLGLRCLGLANGASPQRVALELSKPTDEHEIFFNGGRRFVFRLERGVSAILPRARDTGSALRLATRSGTGRGLLGWAAGARAMPDADEIEVEVAATGLNFRDVMWNLGLLPEEALEDGFSGPTLGMECAGTVTSVGAGSTDFEIGDRVLAFASGSFASHVVVPAFAATKIPSHLSFEAAATLPVAFLTAYYSLVHLAQLRAGETVLIHGGAGAVGLAALQIAKLCGARVIATAGSEEKRALLRNLGADLVLNSRSLRFADEILSRSDAKGVDVVLNSLAGEAMVRSIECLRPQGRFIELGKRDFYTNTHLGLRPFRRNLTYFGVDIDQLIGEQRELMQRLFKELVNLFATDALVPLPYRVFPGEIIADAFRHMQRAAHVGKIVVTPALTETAAPESVFQLPVRADGLHIVIGGTRGFGLATAEWLANKGARHLVLVSRTGRISDDAIAQVEALRQQVDVEIAAIDVTDASKLGDFIRRVNAKRSVAGIVHAAMVLDDRLIDGMDQEAIEAALLPKMIGALNLETLAKQLSLDYLLLYSSATTVLGNPGQFNYVAANGFLEGLARRGHAAGLPVLAVAWGAIQDTGYLARNMTSNLGLKRKFGASMLPSRVALDALAQTWSRTEGCSVLAKIDWPMARRELATVRSPAFDSIGAAAGTRQGSDTAAVLEKLKALPLEQATEALVDIIVEEIARVLRLAPKEVDRHRPLAEIGMDSLMMLELRMTVEETLQIDLPLMSLANGISPADIARRIAPLLFADSNKERAVPGTLAAMASSHVAADAQATAAHDRQAAADRLLKQVRTIEGPL